MAKPKIGILISGRGSNMVALLDAIREGRLDAEAAVVISNLESAAGLGKARDRGVETLVINHKGRTREEHDQEIVAALKLRNVSLVCLAGYMRLLGSSFVRSFENRILNIHPSLLPAFPGLDAQRQALEHGVKISGCTVHVVDEHLDHGPIVLQRAVEVLDHDTVETLSARILEQEHRLYPAAVALMLSEGFRIDGRRTRISD
jgi:phosphoribosylglycinamide formyltransferase 1